MAGYVFRRVVAAILIALCLWALGQAGVHAAEPCVVVVASSEAPDPSSVPSTVPCTVQLAEEDRARLDALAVGQGDSLTVMTYAAGLVIFLGAAAAVAVGLRR